MGRIKNKDRYTLIPPSLDDYIIGSDNSNSGKTQNYTFGSVIDLVESTLGVVTSSNTTRLVSGGMIWVSGLTYKSANLVYDINGVRFTIADDTEVTLNAAPTTGTNQRIDLIYGTDSGTLAVSEGTEAESPVANTLEFNELQLSLALLNTNATTPTGITETLVHAENVGQPTEWDATENTGGVRIDLANPVDQIAGTVGIKTLAPTQLGDKITFTSASTFTYDEFSRLSLKMALISWTPTGNSLVTVKVSSSVNGAYFLFVLLSPSAVPNQTLDSSNIGGVQNISLLKGYIIADSGTNVNTSDFDTIELNLNAGVEARVDDIYLIADTGAAQPLQYALVGHTHTVSDITDINDTFVRRDGTTPLLGNWDAGAFEIEANKFLSDSGAGSSAYINANGLNSTYSSLGNSGSLVASGSILNFSVSSVGGDRATLLCNTGGFKLTKTIGGSDNFGFSLGTPTTGIGVNGTEIILNSPSTASALETFYVPLTVSGIKADINGEVTITKAIIDSLSVDASTLGGLSSTDFDLQKVIENGSTANIGNDYIILNPALSGLGYIYTEFNDGIGSSSVFEQDVDQFTASVTDGTQTSLLNVLTSSLSLKRTVGANTAELFLLDPITTNTQFEIKTPTGTAPSTVFKIPLSVNGQFADADANIAVSIDGGNATTLDTLDSTQFLRSDVADNKTAGDLTFNDNVKIALGTGGLESEIYSDAANTILNLLSGDLKVFNNGVEVTNISRTDGSITPASGNLHVKGDFRAGADSVSSCTLSAYGSATKAAQLFAGGAGAFFQYDDSGIFGIRPASRALIEVGSYDTGDLAFLTNSTGKVGIGGSMLYNGSSFANAAIICHSSKNVSIGNENDTYKLDVSGTGNFTGALTIPADAYAAGWASKQEAAPKAAVYDKIESLIPSSGTGTVIDLSNIRGHYMNMSSSNTATTYTTTGETLGGFAVVKINAASEPTITGGTKIAGSTFVISTDMHLFVQYFGATVQYFFAEL